MNVLKYKGRVISVFSSHRKLPNGVKTNLDIVLHPGAVLIIPFLNSRQIIFIRQYRPVIGKYLFELPAGTLKPREHIFDCAHRELIEETGHKAKKLTRLGMIYPVPGYSTEIITIFKAEGLSEQPGQQDFDEMITIRPFTRTAIKKLFHEGRITDAKTICALSLSGVLS